MPPLARSGILVTAMKTKIPSKTIGLDLGDRKHAYCVLDVCGEIIEEGSVGSDRESLRRLSKKYRRARMVMEVGMQSPWTSRFLESLGHEVLVANARKVRAIHTNTRKSDKVDAMMLARLGRADVRLLHPVRHGSEEAQRDLLQVKLRDNVVRQRVDVISAVRFTLKSLGIRVPSPNTDCFAKRCRQILEADHGEVLMMVEPSLRVIEEMTRVIREYGRKIEEMCVERYPETQRLREIGGVGAITALSFVLTIGDPKRFPVTRDVGAYLGLVPRRDQSGEVDKQLRITKAGDAYLRRLLVGSAHYILGPFGPDCDLKRHGLALCERGGPRAKRKAVVATARKLAVLMLALWSQEADYQPNRQQEAAA